MHHFSWSAPENVSGMRHPTGTSLPAPSRNPDFLGIYGAPRYLPARLSRGIRVVYPCLSPVEESPMSELANPIFWNMKIKIAILTLATFAALC
jgi:hypothetical protein